MKGFSSKRIILKVDCYGTGKYTVCRRVRAYFSPEILQAGAVKGLRKNKTGGPVELSRVGTKCTGSQEPSRQSSVQVPPTSYGLAEVG